jgi:hypothetical protein
MSENKLNYVDFIEWVPREEAQAGDILVHHDGELKIINIKSYIPGMSGEPIAVVYASADVMPDNIPRAISLCNMSIISPETGSLEIEPTDGNIIPWGKYLDILESFEGLPQLNEGYMIKDEKAYHGYVSSSSIFPTTNNSQTGERRIRDLTSGKFFDFEGNSINDILSDSGYVIPNPNSLPEFYFLGATSDIDGKKNTQEVVNHIGLDCVLDENFLKKVIELDLKEFLLSSYPAFTTCFLFNPSITEKGDWYLPSIGELGVFLSNLGEVNNSLGILEKEGRALRLCADNMALEQLPGGIESDPDWPEGEGIFYYYNYTKYGSWLWSSTQYDYEYCWTANTSSCYMSSESSKEDVYRDFRVRASIML